jgi:hypothetical protein
MVNAGIDATAGGTVLSLPSAGGAISGLGGKFSPDVFTGMGTFSVPIAVPPVALARSPGSWLERSFNAPSVGAHAARLRPDPGRWT